MSNAQPARPSSPASPIGKRIPESFYVHSRSETAELAIASDFYATTGRTVGAFTDLVPRLEADLAVWETLTPPAGTEIGMTAGDYLDRWLADVRASDHVVHTV